MGQHIPRTAADELHDVQAALAETRAALRNAESQLASIISNPDEPAGRAYEARRNLRIAEASIAAAGKAASDLGRDQLTAVS